MRDVIFVLIMMIFVLIMMIVVLLIILPLREFPLTCKQCVYVMSNIFTFCTKIGIIVKMKTMNSKFFFFQQFILFSYFYIIFIWFNKNLISLSFQNLALDFLFSYLLFFYNVHVYFYFILSSFLRIFCRPG